MNGATKKVAKRTSIMDRRTVRPWSLSDVQLGKRRIDFFMAMVARRVAPKNALRKVNAWCTGHGGRESWVPRHRDGTEPQGGDSDSLKAAEAD